MPDNEKEKVQAELRPCPYCGLSMKRSHREAKQWWCDHCALHVWDIVAHA